jgi:hypothetical protein
MGCIRSASALLPVILEFCTQPWPRTILDVGAGEGHWTRHAAECCPGAVVLGVDKEPGPGVEAWDAENGDRLPMPLEGKWELALCLEVAEHVDADAGAWLVGELCAAADVIAWSAAIPRQGGDGHKNEQWPSYWAPLFREQGYALIDPWREEVWEDTRIEPWYRQNILCAVAAVGDWPEPRAFVHPEIYGWKVGLA